MPLFLVLALFAASLALSVGASFVLSRELDRIGVRLGITEGLVRFSAGLEHPDDVIEDVLAALKAV